MQVQRVYKQASGIIHDTSRSLMYIDCALLREVGLMSDVRSKEIQRKEKKRKKLKKNRTVKSKRPMKMR